MTPIILIRFSFLTDEPILANFEDRQKFAEYLFDIKRLEYRLKLFEKFCLPSLLGQSDPDFCVLMLTSPDLPDWARQRLSELMSPISNARIFSQPFMPLGEGFQEILDTHYPNVDMRLTICLDDDDAISVDWVQKSRQIAQAGSNFLKLGKSFAFYPNKGLILNFNHTTAPVFGVQMKEPYALGLAHLAKKDCKINVY